MKNSTFTNLYYIINEIEKKINKNINVILQSGKNNSIILKIFVLNNTSDPIDMGYEREINVNAHKQLNISETNYIQYIIDEFICDYAAIRG